MNWITRSYCNLAINPIRWHRTECWCDASGLLWGWHLTFVFPLESSSWVGVILILLPATVSLKKKPVLCHVTWMSKRGLQLWISVNLPWRWRLLSDSCVSSYFFCPLHLPFFPLICLTGTLMILKSACSYNASYIDRLISVFMRSLHKMVREHLSPQQANPGVTETSTGTHSISNLAELFVVLN